jgi:hypothetical protein
MPNRKPVERRFYAEAATGVMEVWSNPSYLASLPPPPHRRRRRTGPRRQRARGRIG